MNDPQMQRIRELERAAKAAIDGHKKAVAGLYGPNNIPKFPEDRMEELRRYFDSERRKALVSIEEITQEIVVEAQQEAQLAAQFPPDDVLSGGERATAQGQLPFAEADVASMSTEQLTERLRGILAGTSRADKFVYWMAARNRQREMRERRQSQQGRGEYLGVEASVTPLDYLVSELEEQLLGEEIRRRTEKVGKRRQAAIDLQRLCYTGRHGADSVAGALENQEMHPAVRRAREAAASGVAGGAVGGGRIAN